MSEPLPPPLPVRAPTRWWQRHWKWLAILGGLTLVTLIVGSTMLLLNFVTGKLRQSEPYRYAMAATQGDAEVAEALGSPVAAGTIISGNFNEGNGRSDFNMVIPISGPKGAGFLQVAAQKADEKWSYTTLQVLVTASKQTIVLKRAGPSSE